MRRRINVAAWSVSALCLLAGGVITTEFVLMATDMDPAEAIGAGARPWIDAALVTGAFLALAITVVAKLTALHSRRFRTIGIVLTAVEIAAVGWACARVYGDYF